MSFNNLKISRKLGLGFAAVVLAMAGMGGAMLANLRSLDAARAEVTESEAALVALSEAKFYLTRQENSYRGYLLSQNPYYLERLDAHRANFKARLEGLRPLLADTASVAAKIDEAEAASDKWFEQVVGAGKSLASDPATLPQAIEMVGPDGLADGLISPAEDAIDAMAQAEQ